MRPHVSSMTVFCPIWDKQLSYIVSDGIIRFPVCPAKREVASGSLRRYLKALARERDLRPSKRKNLSLSVWVANLPGDF